MKFSSKDFGKYVNVGTDKDSPHWFAKINWVGIGPQTIKQTERFIKQLQKACNFARKLK